MRGEVLPRKRLRACPYELRALHQSRDGSHVSPPCLAPPGPVLPAGWGVGGGARAGGVVVAALEDEQGAAFDLGHDAREGRVDERVEGGIAEEVVGDVDLEAFMGGDGGGEGVQDVCEGWEGAGGELAAWC